VPVICPTCQTLFRTVVQSRNERAEKLKKPAAVNLATGSHRFRDDANLHLICPTCQILIKMQQNQLGRLKPILQRLLPKKAKPAAALAARAL
jgi:hypothetical protein